MRLAANRLAFGYPGRPVGYEVDLAVTAGDAVTAGEVLCLLGPNGSGKTTFFKTLLGLLKAQGGTVTLDGVNIAGFSRQQLAQAMAYVPQASSGYFPYTVLETVLMGRTARIGLFATPSRRDRMAAQAALAQLHLDELQNAVFTRLSGGQRQLVLIARALAQQPHFLIMDEPTASLDFGNQVLVLSHIQALSRQGIGIILSTHDPDQAFACADRVALLHEGRLLCCGPPEDVITPANLRLLYGVEVQIATLADSNRRVCVPRLSS
jgi:iron complex transport system ATP-binding protein